MAMEEIGFSSIHTFIREASNDCNPKGVLPQR
jgi:hypothetical protein